MNKKTLKKQSFAWNREIFYLVALAKVIFDFLVAKVFSRKKSFFSPKAYYYYNIYIYIYITLYIYIYKRSYICKFKQNLDKLLI